MGNAVKPVREGVIPRRVHHFTMPDDPLLNRSAGSIFEPSRLYNVYDQVLAKVCVMVLIFA